MKNLDLEVYVRTYLHESKSKYWQSFHAVIRSEQHSNKAVGYLSGSRYGKNDPAHGVAAMTAAYSLSFEFADAMWCDPTKEIEPSVLTHGLLDRFSRRHMSAVANMSKKVSQKERNGYSESTMRHVGQVFRFDETATKDTLSELVSSEVLHKAADRDFVAGRIRENTTWSTFLRVAIRALNGSVVTFPSTESGTDLIDTEFKKPVTSLAKEYGSIWGDFA